VDRLKDWGRSRSMSRGLKRLGLEAPHHSPAELALLRPVADALVADLASTLGRTEARATDLVGSIIRTSFFGDDPESLALNFAEKVQEEVHDSFADTTWPAGPLDRRHPLWLHQQSGELWWTCTPG
jgi:hypothetical protein